MTVHLVALFPGSESLKGLETTVRSHSDTLTDLSSPLLIPLPYSPSLPFPLLLSCTLLPLLSLLPLPCSLQPLLSPEELEKTRAIVKEFGREGGAGERLQQALLERAKNRENWVGDQWEEGVRVGGFENKWVAKCE